MQNSHSSSTPKVVGGIVISAVLLIGVYVFVLNNKPRTASTASSAVSSATSDTTAATTATVATPTATPQAAASTDTVTTATTSGYKDGTYSGSQSYRVPRSTAALSAKVTLKDGVITAVTANGQYEDRESAAYINSFASSVSNKVVGKKIDSSLSSRIGGASLTSAAFLDIISSIMSQAKA